MNEYTRMLVAKMREVGKVEYTYQCHVFVPHDLPGMKMTVVGMGNTQDEAIEDAYNRCVALRVWQRNDKETAE